MVNSKSTENIIDAIQGWRMIAKYNGYSLEQLHFDADPNFLAKDFLAALNRMGILSSHSAPNQQWTIGLVERFISTIIGPSGLPSKFFPHAYGVFLYNLRHNRQLKKDPVYHGSTPFEIQHGFKFTKPTPAFGQLCFARAPQSTNHNISKYFQKNAVRCAFLGYEVSYDMRHPVAILLNIESGRVIRSNDFTIFKNRYGYNLKSITSESPNFGMITGLNHLPEQSYSDFMRQLSDFDEPTPKSPPYNVPFHTILNIANQHPDFPTAYVRTCNENEQQKIVNMKLDTTLLQRDAIYHAFNLTIASKIVSGSSIRIPRNYKESLKPEFASLNNVRTGKG